MSPDTIVVVSCQRDIPAARRKFPGARVISVGCHIAGYQANLILLDDIEKDADEEMKRRIREWVDSTLVCRLIPEAAGIFMLKPYVPAHNDSGRLLDETGAEVQDQPEGGGFFPADYRAK